MFTNHSLMSIEKIKPLLAFSISMGVGIYASRLHQIIIVPGLIAWRRQAGYRYHFDDDNAVYTIDDLADQYYHGHFNSSWYGWAPDNLSKGSSHCLWHSWPCTSQVGFGWTAHGANYEQKDAWRPCGMEKSLLLSAEWWLHPIIDLFKKHLKPVLLKLTIQIIIIRLSK